MSEQIQIKKNGNHTLFLPAFIDDYGFTPEEFRVFSRIMRRSLGSDGDCYESVPNLAKNLLMSERLVKRALRVLTACRAITRTERPGKSDLFDFLTTDQWKPKTQLTAIRAKIDAEIKQKDRERKVEKKPLVSAETHPVSGCGNAGGVGAETHPVVGAETHPEGIPSEGTPIKGENTSPTNFKSFAQNELIIATESELNFSLDNDAQSRIIEVVPASLQTGWIDIVKNRMLGNKDKHPNYLKTRIGYWLEDFQKNFRFQLVAAAATTSNTVKTVRTQEEKAADFAKQNYHDRKTPVVYIGGNQ